MKRLYGLGARKFVVVGVGPLGCIPFVRALFLLPGGKCSAEVNTFVQGYNKKLRAALDRLNREMGPEAIFVHANSYDVFLRLLQNYAQFGNAPISEFALMRPNLIRKILEKHSIHALIYIYIFYHVMSGFENSEDPCCGGYFPPFVCLKGSDANTSSFLCENRSKYLFWDAYHPSEAANIIVAESLLNGGQSVSSPINIRKLYRYSPS